MAYYYIDKKNDFEMFVYKNSVSSKTETKEGEGLFFQESKERLLLPELRSVDFILKIEGDQKYLCRTPRKNQNNYRGCFCF